jgi:hypothetical protein
MVHRVLTDQGYWMVLKDTVSISDGFIGNQESFIGNWRFSWIRIFPGLGALELKRVGE